MCYRLCRHSLDTNKEAGKKPQNGRKTENAASNAKESKSPKGSSNPSPDNKCTDEQGAVDATIASCPVE